jgi:hypothetical protein
VRQANRLPTVRVFSRSSARNEGLLSRLESGEIFDHASAAKQNLAFAWFEQADDHLHGRTLAGAIPPHVSENLAR